MYYDLKLTHSIIPIEDSDKQDIKNPLNKSKIYAVYQGFRLAVVM